MRAKTILSLLFLFVALFSCNKDEDDNYGLENKQMKIELEATSGGTVSGGGAFKFGETINVEAKAEEEYIFDAWYIEGEKYSVSNPFTITVENDLKLTARFIKNAYSVKLNNEDGGTVSGAGNYQSGEKITIIAQAGEYHTFGGWYSNGTKVTNDSSYTFDIYSSKEFTAKFLPKIYVDIDIELFDKTYHPVANTNVPQIYQNTKIKVSLFNYESKKRKAFYTDEEIGLELNIEHEEGFCAGGSHSVAVGRTENVNKVYYPKLNGITTTSLDFQFKNTSMSYNRPFVSRIISISNLTMYRNTNSKGQLILKPTQVTIHRNGSESNYTQLIN